MALYFLDPKREKMKGAKPDVRIECQAHPAMKGSSSRFPLWARSAPVSEARLI